MKIKNQYTVQYQALMVWIAKVSKMNQRTKQLDQCQIPEHVRSFFWDRYIDRALSKLASTIDPSKFEKVDRGLCGDANITMAVSEIDVNRAVPDPVCLCMCCGSGLETSECPTCFTMLVGHKMGWCYFIVENFQGQDYAVTFVNDESFNYEVMCLDIGKRFEGEFIGPYIARNLNVSTKPMGFKRVKEQNL